MSTTKEIILHEPSLQVVKRHGTELSNIIDSKFGCLVTYEGVGNDFGSASRKRVPVAPQQRATHKLRCGVEVEVWKGDLSNFPYAEAIVNAANTQLKHGGGLAQALSDAGGPQLQMESDDYVSKYGPLKRGDAVVLNAWSLPNRKIIHTVGPDLPLNPTPDVVKQAEGVLKKAIKSILNAVEMSSFSSVAVPAISSGLFHYPLQECADTIVSTIKEYYSQYPSFLPKTIFLVNNDDPTVREMERACSGILGPGSPALYSQAVASNTRGATKASGLTIQIGNVSLTLKMDLIEEQKTEVIVNSTSQSVDLSQGAVSKALLNKAGSKLQEEIKRAKTSGRIIVTSGQKLKCKEVYHTLCYYRSTPGSSEFFHDSVLECLKTAATRRHRSISFPAIGTGSLKFSEEEAAGIMLQAVNSFVPMCPQKMDVYIVIHHSDSRLFKVFETQMKKWQKNLNLPSYDQGFGDRAEHQSGRSPTPRIILSGASRESVLEAEAWLDRLFFNSSKHYTIQNNFIQHLGKVEYQQLCDLNRDGVRVEEFFAQGHSCIQVDGASREKLLSAVLTVEAMLCQVMREFVSAEQEEMFSLTGKRSSKKLRTVERGSSEFSNREHAFRNESIRVVKVERVENLVLEMLFDLKKRQMSSQKSQIMFQRVSLQFCDTVSKVGFHAECAPPEDPHLGEGIYFADRIKEATSLWKIRNERYMYFVEAEVLTGTSAPGRPGLILPPPMGSDPHVLHDSVHGPRGVSVIFTGYQALPKYIITCEEAAQTSYL